MILILSVHWKLKLGTNIEYLLMNPDKVAEISVVLAEVEADIGADAGGILVGRLNVPIIIVGLSPSLTTIILNTNHFRRPQNVYQNMKREDLDNLNREHAE